MMSCSPTTNSTGIRVRASSAGDHAGARPFTVFSVTALKLAICR